MGLLSDLLTTPDWQLDGACAGQDPDLWWSEDPHDVGKKIAVAICGTCPVQRECLEHAMSRPEREGIWGGLMPHERRRLAVHRREAVA